MEFKKITISLPENLYKEGMDLVNRGLFSNFSDLIRSGIREEFKELRNIVRDMDDRLIYNDERLVASVKESMAEAKSGKGKIIKSDKAMNKYFDSL